MARLVGAGVASLVGAGARGKASAHRVKSRDCSHCSPSRRHVDDDIDDVDVVDALAADYTPSAAAKPPFALNENQPESESPPPLLRRFCAPRFWPLWLAIALLRALAWLPLPVIYALGCVAGDAAYALHGSRRRIARRNLRACFPDKRDADIRRLAREHFRALVIAVLAGGIAWWGGRARLRRLTQFRGRDIYDNARARGANIIVLAPHFMGLEHGGMRLSVDAPMVSMYQRHKNPLLDALIHRRRARFGAIQYDRRRAPKAMLRLIRAGRPFYYLPDQDPGRNAAVFAPFFGVPAATFSALGRIARLADATVIPCATRLLPRGRGFEVMFGAPLANYPSGDDIADATAMNRAIEDLIARAPAQYLWSHRRFKTRPPGEEAFYRDN